MPWGLRSVRREREARRKVMMMDVRKSMSDRAPYSYCFAVHGTGTGKRGGNEGSDDNVAQGVS